MTEPRRPLGAVPAEADGPRERYAAALRLVFPSAPPGQLARARAAADEYAAALVERCARSPYPPPKRQPRGAA